MSGPADDRGPGRERNLEPAFPVEGSPVPDREGGPGGDSGGRRRAPPPPGGRGPEDATFEPGGASSEGSGGVRPDEAGASWRRIGLGLGVVVGLVALLGFEAYRTRAVRGAVRSFAALVTAANDGDLARAEGLCSRRYRAGHRLELAAEGGLVGLPRNVNKNFQAWRRGDDVLICPTNRVGPVYRFVEEEGAWRFDGTVGLLMPDGSVAEAGDFSEAGPR